MGDEPASIHFDRAAEFYDATRSIGDETTERTVDVLAREIARRGRVLEIGVGTGIMALPLRSRGVDVVGVDLSEAMLRQLVRKANARAPLPLIRADATTLPFADGTFGAAYARHVLHLIRNWRGAVAELCRVVRRGVVMIEAGGSTRDGWTAIWDAMRSVLGPEAEHVGLDMSKAGGRQLDDAFMEAGALPRDVEEIPYPDDDTVARMLDEVERRTPSWTWRVSDQDLRNAVEAGKRWTLDRYGTLDVRPEETAYVRWRAYDLDP